MHCKYPARISQGFENGIKRMSGFVEDAKDGLKTSTDALDKLGISVEDLQGLSPEESFRMLSSAIADLPDEVQKAALAQDVFGRSGTRLLPLLKEGSEGIAALRQEATIWVSYLTKTPPTAQRTFQIR